MNIEDIEDQIVEKEYHIGQMDQDIQRYEQAIEGMKRVRQEYQDILNDLLGKRTKIS